MGVNNVAGGNQNLIEQLSHAVEDFAADVQHFAHDAAEQMHQPIGENSALGFLQQQGGQVRSRLESALSVFTALGQTAEVRHAAPSNAVVNNAPLAQKQFDTEVLHNTGAVYRKVATEPGTHAFGLRSEDGTIPRVQIDGRRFNFPNGDRSFKALNDPAIAGSQTVPRDTPSIYMGGRGNMRASKDGTPDKASGVEIDAGLAWKRTFTADKKAVWTTAANGSSRTDQYTMSQNSKTGEITVTDRTGKTIAKGSEFKPQDDGSVTIGGKTFRPNFAYRPFFRSSDKPTLAEKNAGYDKEYARAGTDTDREFYAGDKFTMSMTVDPQKPDQTTFGVRGTTTDGAQIAASTKTKTIKNFGEGLREFKRVDSIDQKGREGVDGNKIIIKEINNKKVKETIVGAGSYEGTRTTVTNGSWGATSVLNKDGTRTPFTGANGKAQRSVEFNKDYDAVFGLGKERTTRADGSEAIYINPPDQR